MPKLRSSDISYDTDTNTIIRENLKFKIRHWNTIIKN